MTDLTIAKLGNHHDNFINITLIPTYEDSSYDYFKDGKNEEKLSVTILYYYLTAIEKTGKESCEFYQWFIKKFNANEEIFETRDDIIEKSKSLLYHEIINVWELEIIANEISHCEILSFNYESDFFEQKKEKYKNVKFKLSFPEAPNLPNLKNFSFESPLDFNLIEFI